MKSIRGQLTIWILGGLAILLIGAGAGVYFSVKESLIKSVDAELAIDARIVRFAARGENDDESRSPFSRRLQERLPSYDEPAGDAFFQRWDTAGNLLEKSASLQELELEFPGGKIPTDPKFATGVLADGREIRTMEFRTSAGGKGKGKGKGKGARESSSNITVLAKEIESINASLSSMVAGLIIIGIVAAIAAIFIVGLALKHGLRPIEQLAKQSTEISAESLDSRFDGSEAPSELQPIYDHLNDLIHRLETSFDRERRFSSDLAHEMRTPVAELKMINEVALKWPDQAGEDIHSENLEIANQLNEMIESLLSLARWESGEFEVKQESVDLNKHLQQCWKSFSEKAEAKQLDVSFDLESIEEVETDPMMLRHILNNLFSNAVEYAPEKSSVRISSAKDRIEITNAAPSMKSEQVGAMFDRYWRGDASRTGSNHAGLGLSLAKTCASVLGFSLSAQLEGENLTFTLKTNQ